MFRALYLTAVLLSVTTAAVSSQGGKPVVPLGPTTKSGAPTKNGHALINGTAVDNHAAPLPNAIVRLRNLERTRIEQVVVANQSGQFTFIAAPEVPYVVEITDGAGRLLAVGDIIIAQAGDVAAATVSIPSRLPAIAGLFGETATSVLSAATGTGITVIDPPPPLSPEK